jgi:hypothetical protein
VPHACGFCKGRIPQTRLLGIFSCRSLANLAKLVDAESPTLSHRTRKDGAPCFRIYLQRSRQNEQFTDWVKVWSGFRHICGTLYRIRSHRQRRGQMARACARAVRPMPQLDSKYAVTGWTPDGASVYMSPTTFVRRRRRSIG